MLPARTYSVSIERNWKALYEQIWHPNFFSKWAIGLSESQLREEGGHWIDDGEDPPLKFRFSPHNDHGVMDHWVDAGDGEIVHVPLRIVENGDGAEVMLTLYRQPDMDDERFSRDAKLIMRDLKALKNLIENKASRR
ncbi:polyketide cyclase [Sphingobium boeckii]|uniref:Polyketide cyclase n=1 Tax=Sphingobium boeckii TaxID=1082345 RepID=A0A7W9AJU6_9SPHN|nr:polyketide cyclase [Sphingobium boeckii]MBB5686893.1 hypothetical protein [Sphingobium boeckii]